MPADDHAIALPCASEIVIIVLLKLEFTWATPAVMFFETFFLVVARLSRAMLVPYFFLPAIGLAGPLRVRALVWVRWPRTGRPRRWRRPAIAAEIHQPLDVHRILAGAGRPRPARFASIYSRMAPPRHPTARSPGARSGCRPRRRSASRWSADAVHIGEGDRRPFRGRDVYACDARHVVCSVCPWPRRPGAVFRAAFPATGPRLSGLTVPSARRARECETRLGRIGLYASPHRPCKGRARSTPPLSQADSDLRGRRLDIGHAVHRLQLAPS